MGVVTGTPPAEPVLDRAASAAVLDRLRREAIDGLLALPRFGMGMGGYLAGIRHDGRIQAAGHVAIPCAHARGPGFLLTAEELGSAKQLASTSAPLEIQGMYISRTRGPAEPSDADLEMFSELCPSAGQVLLVIRPSTVEAVRAALFVRTSEGGDLRKAVEFIMDAELQSVPFRNAAPVEDASPGANRPMRPVAGVIASAIAAAETPVVPTPDVSAAKTVLPLQSGGATEQPAPDPAHLAPKPGPVRPQPAAVPAAAPAGKIPAETAPPAPASRPADVARPHRAPRHSILFHEPVRAKNDRRRFLYIVGAGVLAPIVAILLATRGSWMPEQPLALAAAHEHGDVIFRWSPGAVSGANRGRLVVNDAGQLSEFELAAPVLASGRFSYPAKSDQIVAKLVVGDREARAVLFGEPRPRAAPAPAAPTPGSARPDRGFAQGLRP